MKWQSLLDTVNTENDRIACFVFLRTICQYHWRGKNHFLEPNQNKESRTRGFSPQTTSERESRAMFQNPQGNNNLNFRLPRDQVVHRKLKDSFAMYLLAMGSNKYFVFRIVICNELVLDCLTVNTGLFPRRLWMLIIEQAPPNFVIFFVINLSGNNLVW